MLGFVEVVVQLAGGRSRHPALVDRLFDQGFGTL
jgi:hypothetical protein